MAKLQTRQRRFSTPDALTANPKIEPVHQPLYSTAALASGALPSSVSFFSYGKSGAISGSGNASGTARAWHTNLERAGQLAQPQVFVVQGVILHMPLLAFTAADTPGLSDPGFGTAAVDSDALEDALTIFWSGAFEFRVGTKLFVDHPTFMVPSNRFYCGAAAVGQDNGTAATVGSLDVSLPGTVGRGYRMPTYPIVIASMQSFSAKLSFPWATPPSLSDHRAIVCMLNGLHGREVQ